MLDGRCEGCAGCGCVVFAGGTVSAAVPNCAVAPGPTRITCGPALAGPGVAENGDGLGRGAMAGCCTSSRGSSKVATGDGVAVPNVIAAGVLGALVVGRITRPPIIEAPPPLPWRAVST